MEEELCKAIARGMLKCPNIKCQMGKNIGGKDIVVIARELIKEGYHKLPNKEGQ